jgi:hypothetical protein
MAIVRVDGILLRGGIDDPLSPHVGGLSQMGHHDERPKNSRTFNHNRNELAVEYHHPLNCQARLMVCPHLVAASRSMELALPLLQTTPDFWEKIIAINYKSVPAMLCCLIG